MKYLHTMVRVSDLDASLRFYCEGLGLKEVKRKESPEGRFTLIFLAAPDDLDQARPKADQRGTAQIELTYNWPNPDGTPKTYNEGSHFGHIAVDVDDIYALCQHLMNMGYVINRPPRDGHMAFVRSPDLISFELLQRKDKPLAPCEPWLSMPNIGSW